MSNLSIIISAKCNVDTWNEEKKIMFIIKNTSSETNLFSLEYKHFCSFVRYS